MIHLNRATTSIYRWRCEYFQAGAEVAAEEIPNTARSAVRLHLIPTNQQPIRQIPDYSEYGNGAWLSHVEIYG